MDPPESLSNRIFMGRNRSVWRNMTTFQQDCAVPEGSTRNPVSRWHLDMVWAAYLQSPLWFQCTLQGHQSMVAITKITPNYHTSSTWNELHSNFIQFCGGVSPWTSHAHWHRLDVVQPMSGIGVDVPCRETCRLRWSKDGDEAWHGHQC